MTQFPPPDPLEGIPNIALWIMMQQLQSSERPKDLTELEAWLCRVNPPRQFYADYYLSQESKGEESVSLKTFNTLWKSTGAIVFSLRFSPWKPEEKVCA